MALWRFYTSNGTSVVPTDIVVLTPHGGRRAIPSLLAHLTGLGHAGLSLEGVDSNEVVSIMEATELLEQLPFGEFHRV